MSSTPQAQVPAISTLCPNCAEVLQAGKAYCANCGLFVGASSDAVALRAYVDSKLATELNTRITSDGGVVRELADKVEDIVWVRMKRYGVIAGGALAVIAALLTFIGLNTYSDIKSSVLKQVQPAVAQIEHKANDINLKVDDLENNRLPAVNESLNQVDKEAKAQKERVEGADGQIAKSMSALESAQRKATADSETFNRTLVENEQKLEQITKRSEDQISQITKAAGQAAITQAYPNLGQEPQITIGNQIASVKDKKLGEKWLSLVVDYSAIRENTFTTEQIEQVQSDLTASGYRVFVGTVQVSGRIAVGFSRIGPDISGFDSEVFYYDKSKSGLADEVYGKVSKHLKLVGAKPILVEGSTIPAGFGTGIRYFQLNSGIDAQVFLGSEKGK